MNREFSPQWLYSQFVQQEAVVTDCPRQLLIWSGRETVCMLPAILPNGWESFPLTHFRGEQ